MKRIATHVGLALVLLSAGCAKQPAGDSQPAPGETAEQTEPTVPDLSDCILFTLRDRHEFTPEDREALAAIFGDSVFFEYHTVGHLAAGPPGMVMVVIEPSQPQTLAYEVTYEGDAYQQVVPGFFPEVAEGRLPAELGEALIMSAPDSAGEGDEQDDGALLQGARREPGAEFVAYPLPKHTLTVVGICDGVMPGQETVWVLHAPERDKRSYGQRRERASAMLDNPAQYDTIREQLALTGLSWSAIRLRDGAADPDWVGGPKLGISARVENEGEVRLRLGVQGPGGPLPAGEVSLSWDGEPLKVEWWTPVLHDDGEGYDEVPMGNAFEVGPRYIADLGLEPDGARHHIVAYIEGRPEASWFFEWPK